MSWRWWCVAAVGLVQGCGGSGSLWGPPKVLPTPRSLAGLRIYLHENDGMNAIECDASEDRGMRNTLRAFRASALAPELIRAGFQVVTDASAPRDLTARLTGRGNCIGPDHFSEISLSLEAEGTLLEQVSVSKNILSGGSNPDVAPELLNSLLRSARLLGFAARRLRTISERQAGERQLIALLDSAAKGGAVRQALDAYAQYARTAEPSDEVRKRVILLSRATKPPPSTPEDARRHAVYGMTAAKEARTAADYATAAREYRTALRLAPWWADAYMNLALVEEQGGNFAGAAWALRFYLVAAPSAPDAPNVQTKIYELEFKARRRGVPP